MTEHESLWPYTERNGSLAPGAVDVLMAPAQYEWDAVERAEFAAFADDLMHGERVSADIQSLESVYNTSIERGSSTYYLDYFTTEKGEADLQAFDVEGVTATDFEAILFTAIAQGVVPASKARAALAAESAKWYKSELQGRLLRISESDEQHPDSPTARVNFDPDMLLNKFAQVQAYRELYRGVQKDLHSDTSNAVIAKQVILDLHVGRVNNMAAGMYPALLSLARQLELSPQTEAVQKWKERLHEIAPVIASVYADEVPSTAFDDDFARRLDLVRNGAHRTTEGENYSPIDADTLELAQALEAGTVTREALDVPMLQSEAIEHATTTKWNATEMQQFLQHVLAEWNLLSAEQIDWSAVMERSGTATDQKWQVVVTPKVTSLSVNGAKKVMYIPEVFNELLAEQGGGALAKAAHELTHVLQNESDEQLAKQLPLAKIQGRRSTTAREMGGIYQERELLAQFGFSRGTNTTYLRGLERKLAGDNQTQAARAFLSAALSNVENPSETLISKKAQIAGKNILRLFRHGNHDSGALAYIEQDLLQQSLMRMGRDQAGVITVVAGSFSLQDTAALYAAGLIEIPRTLPHDPASDVIDVYLRNYFTKALASL